MFPVMLRFKKGRLVSLKSRPYFLSAYIYSTYIISIVEYYIFFVERSKCFSVSDSEHFNFPPENAYLAGFLKTNLAKFVQLSE